MRLPTAHQAKQKARAAAVKLKGAGKKQAEVAAEAAALNVTWAVVKRLGIFGAGVAAAATTSALLASGPVHLSPGLSLVRYVDAHAPSYGLDPAAALGVANMEGAGGGIGDQGTSFGAWQMHAGGALPLSVYYGPYSARTQAWAWSSSGVNYALQHIGGVCHGVRGYQAVVCIVSRFERPLNPAPEIAGAWRAYAAYAHDHVGLPKPTLPARIRSTVHWFSHYFHVPITGFHGRVVTFRPQRHKPVFAPARLRRMRRWVRRHEHLVSASRHQLRVRFR